MCFQMEAHYSMFFNVYLQVFIASYNECVDI